MPVIGVQLCENGTGVQLCTKGQTTGVKLCSYQECPEKLAEAILERQKAAGITAAWDSGSPTNAAKQISLTYASYTDAHYRAYINQIAPSFLDGTYSGGTDAPSMLTDQYANGIEGCENLYAIVCDMIETSKHISNYSIEDDTTLKLASGEGWDGNPSPEALLAEALENWDKPQAIYAPPRPIDIHVGVYSSWTRRNRLTAYAFEATRWRANATGLFSGIDKKAKFYIKITDPGPGPHSDVTYTVIFDKHGDSNVFDDDDEFHMYDETSWMGRSTTSIKAKFFGSLSLPNTPPMTEGNYTGSRRGYRFNGVYVVITWSFSHA